MSLDVRNYCLHYVRFMSFKLNAIPVTKRNYAWQMMTIKNSKNAYEIKAYEIPTNKNK